MFWKFYFYLNFNLWTFYPHSMWKQTLAVQWDERISKNSLSSHIFMLAKNFSQNSRWKIIITWINEQNSSRIVALPCYTFWLTKSIRTKTFASIKVKCAACQLLSKSGKIYSQTLYFLNLSFTESSYINFCAPKVAKKCGEDSASFSILWEQKSQAELKS